MARRRLLVFTENYARGGGNRYCVDLINGLANSYDEILLAANQDGIFPEDLARLPSNARVAAANFLTRSRARHALRNINKLVRAPWLLLLSVAEPLLFQRNVRLMRRYIRAHQPDAVLGCNGGYPAARATLATMVAAHQCGVPAVMSVVSMPTRRRKNAAAYDKLIDAKVWDSVRLVIVNAHAIAEALTTQHDMPAKLGTIIYNGLPDAPYHADRRVGTDIGFVARLDRAKGVLVLLEAFKQIAFRWPALRLRLIGQGDATDSSRERARQLGVEDRVVMSGFTDDTTGLLESFRIYAFPSFHEGLPYSILEAMRAGCAIVSTAVGGIPEILRDGVEGKLVPPRDVAALSSAMDGLLSDEQESRRLGQGARARFERNYLLKNFHAETVRAFTSAGLIDSGATSE